MRKIKFRKIAEQDLVEIWNYIAFDNKKTADNFIDQIEEKIKLLSRFPNLGIKRNDLKLNLYQYIFKKYNIYYLIKDEYIEVVRILHGYRKINH